LKAFIWLPLSAAISTNFIAPICWAVSAAIEALERLLKKAGRAAPTPKTVGLASLLAASADTDILDNGDL
jgi:hypothetical protein